MKKTLLFVAFLTVLTGVKTHSQTLTFSSLPNNVQVGTTANFTLNYTSTVAAKMEVSLNIFNVDGGGNLTADWSTWQAGTVVMNLPATASSVPQALNLAVPGSVMPSASLPAGKTYVWALSLKDMSDGWITGSQHAVTLVASAAVTDAIAYMGTPEATATIGSTVAVEYSYTLAQPRNIKVALSKYDAGGNWISDVVSEVLQPAAATTSTPVNATANLTIPAGTVPSSALPSGQNYKWEIDVFTTDWGYIMGFKSDVVVTATAGIGDVVKPKFTVYPNPVSGSLLFSSAAAVEKAVIIDATGKTLLSVAENNIENVDVSALATGVYFIRINDKEILKFIKN